MIIPSIPLFCPKCMVPLKYGDGVDSPPLWCPECSMAADTYGDYCRALGIRVIQGDTFLVMAEAHPRPNPDQERVKLFRKEVEKDWPTPTIIDSWSYLVTEVAELGDALLRLGFGEQKGYVRSSKKEPDPGMECGDAYLMLITLANLLGVDLSRALEKTFEKIFKTVERNRREQALSELDPGSFWEDILENDDS